jgi:hypothetical protein
MFHIVDSTGEWHATYADMVTAHRQARTTHGHRYGYLLRGRDGAEMARHVRHVRRKGRQRQMVRLQVVVRLQSF